MTLTRKLAQHYVDARTGSEAARVLPVWTQPVASDLRFRSRQPVFILVSKQTFSAAENLAYTLQALATKASLNGR